MITKSVHKLMNEQINKELYSAYLYLSMAAWFETQNLPGFANWMRIQAGEEQEHAMKFFGHLVERGAKVELKAIAAPPVEWKSGLELVKQVLEHEEAVTASINAIYDQAIADKDYPSQVLLQWYVSEQVEEEKNASELVYQVGAVGSSQSGMLMLDHRVGKRGAE